MNHVEAVIHDGALTPAKPWRVPGAGAVICFEGVVRPHESDQPIAGLHYQSYDPMAQQELDRLAREAIDLFAVLAVSVEHSRGFVANGDCSFRLRIASAHRKEGLTAMDWYIDQMKQVVPIWKRPVPADQPRESPR